ncbi:hypothetical protein FNV43_RR06443 [Rhamnella rubrinervis]|uniref:Uncharacterized protein n=1 Tax=Rhamnella rubrinervis TaxID=2594499 RepID=A0A8K0HDX7_9ROSA|nr:hypothetical protein FNV43_RR06443 [Rhamnella rubrinervis]
MKIWLVLRSYGVEKLRNVLNSHVNLAELFEGVLAADKMFEVVAAPVDFGLVRFRVSSLPISKHEISRLTCGVGLEDGERACNANPKHV